MSYEDSAVLITGGSRGIGLEIAKVFAANTMRPLILIARSSEDLSEAKKICLKEGATEVQTLSIDLSQPEAMDPMPEFDFQPGIVINNAGSFLYKRLAETSSAEMLEQFQTNTLSAFNMTQAILPHLKQLDRGCIINVCSVGALQGLEDSGAYSSSKHALLGYTRSLRKELMHTNIAVTAVNLGQTYSTSWEEVDIAPEKLIDPADVGHLMLSISQLSPRTVVEEMLIYPQKGPVDPM